MSEQSTLHQIPGISQSTVAFVMAVRTYLRDFPELNRLVSGEESEDRFLLFAVNLAVSRFNGSPPATRYSLQNLQEMQQQDLLLSLAVICVLESVMILQARNQLSYSTGGTSVAVNDKAGLLMKMLQYFRATADQELLRRKTAFNIMSILDGAPGVHSEYAVVHNSYVTW